MNSLGLRISQSGCKRTKNPIGHAPVDISRFYENTANKKSFHEFMQAESTDQQLATLRAILGNYKDDYEHAVEFLVAVFFHAEAKHPIKCFLARYITKNPNLQPSFSQTLSSHIQSSLHHTQEPQSYVTVVTKLASCIENFPAGATAFKLVEVELMEYLRSCLQCCVDTLRNTTTLTPTEKNEIFNLAHLALRLLLYLVQKTSQSKLKPVFPDIRLCIHELLFDDDVPMDTKSVCGILYINMHLLKDGPDSWKDMLDNTLLSNDASKLSLYSAITTIVSMETLQSCLICDEPAIIVLCKQILDIGERGSSDSTLTLGVTRTLHQISKQLRLATPAVGLPLADMLLAFCWGHLEHYMDSVRHLTSQILNHIVRYCTRLKIEGDARALNSLFRKLSSLDRSRKSYYLALTSLVNELGAAAIFETLPNVVNDLIAALEAQPVQASATTTLETLLQKHIPHATTADVRTRWLEPVVRHVTKLDHGATLAGSATVHGTSHAQEISTSFDSHGTSHVIKLDQRETTDNATSFDSHGTYATSFDSHGTYATSFDSHGTYATSFDSHEKSHTASFDSQGTLHATQLDRDDTADNATLFDSHGTSHATKLDQPEAAGIATSFESDGTSHATKHDQREIAENATSFDSDGTLHATELDRADTAEIATSFDSHGISHVTSFDSHGISHATSFDSHGPSRATSFDSQGTSHATKHDPREIEGRTFESNVTSIDRNVRSIDSNVRSIDSNVRSIDSNVRSIDSNVRSIDSNVRSIDSNVRSIHSDAMSVGRTPDTTVLTVLENLLARAVTLNENLVTYIVQYIKQWSTTKRDLKCVVMLLSVIRKAGVARKIADGFSHADGAKAQAGNDHASAKSGEDSDGVGEWQGIIGFNVLDQAAIDACEETRILALALVAESPKSTEAVSSGELRFVLRFVKYNMATQAPDFRQLMLSVMKKLLHRLEASYRQHRRQSAVDEYSRFCEALRELCFASLLPMASAGRRQVALQLLLGVERLQLDNSHRIWKPEYVEKVLLHLEDSYESNKVLALEILERCPVEMLQSHKYSVSLELDAILRQASALKPTECVSAAYKLALLMKRLPENILQGEKGSIPELVSYVLLHHIHARLRREVSLCEQSVVAACASAPVYGLLHCMRSVVVLTDQNAISPSDEWRSLIQSIITTCFAANAAVAGVVNSDSPEGHLPMDLGAAQGADVRLDDGRRVTAQMVLLCAWRTVKEVSLLLGELSSRLSVTGEVSSGTLSVSQLEAIGEHFTSLLAETKHRGAFEQAYVGFTKLLARLWRSRCSSLASLPRHWLTQMTSAVDGQGPRGERLCPTRRSAGLPFMIQALVTTELQVQGNPHCFHECITTLLRLARTRPPALSASETAIESRTHAVNILRALFRNSLLEQNVAMYVGEGLLVALEGFEGSTWMERNSATLLLSALCVRIFGVARTRSGSGHPAAATAGNTPPLRNRMTGRVFFLRYPKLYDYMLNKLKEASSSDDTLRPSLYPILLLLARLYPSALEGTVSNLKLVAFVPLVSSCASHQALATRQLAAAALAPLIAPDRYLSHLESMIDLICDDKIKRNYCHGILLQLIKLLETKPEEVTLDSATNQRLAFTMSQTIWILAQANGKQPCYLLTNEYVKVIDLIVWRFPSLINQATMQKIVQNLQELLFFDKDIPKINSGRDVCLSNALYLCFIILTLYGMKSIKDLLYAGLCHKSYEVVLTSLNYLLILYRKLDIESRFQQHLHQISNPTTLENIVNTKYFQLLCYITNTSKYLECVQKSLKLLVLENATEKYIIQTTIKNVEVNDAVIIDTLLYCIQNKHENLMHIYLESLSKFVSRKLKESLMKKDSLLNVLRMVYWSSFSDNSDLTRSVVVGFLEHNVEYLMTFDLNGLSHEDQFEYKSTLFATLVTTLEDDEPSLRQRTSNCIMRFASTRHQVSPLSGHDVIASRAAEELRAMVDDDAVLVLLALMDFKSEVCLSDEGNDECRIFDQNERYNIFLEETIWATECAIKIKERNKSVPNIIEYVLSIVRNTQYRRTFEELCGNHVVLFEKMCNSKPISRTEVINPKISLFVNSLRE